MTTKTWRKGGRHMGRRGATSCGQIPSRGVKENHWKNNKIIYH